MRASRLPVLLFTASLLVGGAGCELIAQIDRSQISPGSGGSGGGGGATSTSTVTSTSSGGGAGGTGGTGGAGGSGGATATSTATSTATGTGGAGGATSSSSSASGTGGAGGSPNICTTAAECPQPAGECVTATCIAGACGTASKPAGTPTTMQTPGDCMKAQCDGNGAIVAANDDTDVNDDSNPCTTDTCSGGVASHTAVAPGVTCGGTQVCNATGSCVGCVLSTTCPGQDDECKTRTCNAGVCGFSFTASGTAVAAQTAADCQKNQCDGAGAIVPVADNADLPVDNLQCTSDVCTAGAPTNPPTASGSACNQGGGTTCNGAGQCVQCITASTCPGQDTECQTRTCAANACGFSFAANGTATSTQAPSNCQKNQCNGAGATVAVADNTDVPVDGNACTSDVCTAGVPSNPPTASGSACNQGGNTTCNGVGQCVQCVTASTCPGQDTGCQTRTCATSACGFSFAANGTPTASGQTPANCQKVTCNGSGGVVSMADNTDLPADGNACTADTCTAGVPTFTPVPAGSSCGAGLVCDAAGTCLGCNTGADCPGSDTECQARSCVNNTCGVAFTPSGTATAAQTTGDCKQNQCNGAGAIVVANHDADLPGDAFQCTADTCTAGVPTFTPVAAGTACNQAGGTLCNAIGDCVQCNTASDCPGTDTDCHVRTCITNSCGVFNTAAGNPTTTQTSSNCQINQCDGAGNAVNVADNSDVPVDNKQCTSDVCTAGVPSNPNLASGTACTQNGGTSCNGAGLCVSSVTTDFVVLRLGDGVTALSSASVAGNLEHRLIDGTSVGTIALPVAVNGTNKPISFAGSSTSEGGLSRSADGHYVTMGGYAAAPATAAIAGTTSAAVNRVVGRVDASSVVDTSTLFTTAFSGANIRSVTSSDGTGFWASGSASGVQYIQLGQTTATQLNTAPTNTRFLHVFNGQLYGSANSGMFVNVFTVGTGLPTTTGQTATSLPGMPTASGPSPHSFVLLDRDALVAGVDTLYVTDDRTVANGGGIQKWSFNGTTWTLAKTLTQGTLGFRGLAGVVTGANVTLIATNTAAAANSIVSFVDDGSAAPAGTVIGTAPALTVYRGIAFAPK